MQNTKERLKYLLNTAALGAVRATVNDHPEMLLKDCSSSLSKRLLGSLLTPKSVDSLLKIFLKEFEIKLETCWLPNNVPGGSKEEICYYQRYQWKMPSLNLSCMDNE